MKLVMTLLVRDEADIIDSHIGFHHAAGVDAFIVTDHDSSDGTTEVLERYARAGVLHLIREPGATFQQSRWVTHMARLAARELGADWVINSDADEFWWPWGGDLKDVLAEIPRRYGRVHTFVRPFLPRPGGGPFVERMTVRLTPAAPINDPTSPFRVNRRVLHRASESVVVSTGNTAVTQSELVPMGGWSPIEVLHFPIRSFAHFKRKFLAHYETVGGRGDHARAYEAAQTGRLEELYAAISVDDVLLRRGLAGGSLAVDTRLRDSLRRLVAAPGVSLAFPRRDPSEEIGYAVDSAVVVAGELVRLQRRVDELERRFGDLAAAGR